MQRCIHQFSSRSTFVHRQILLCGPPFEAAEAVPAAAHVLVLADFRFVVRTTGSAGFFIRGAEAATAAVNSKILVFLLKKLKKNYYCSLFLFYFFISKKKLNKKNTWLIMSTSSGSGASEIASRADMEVEVLTSIASESENKQTSISENFVN
jgi:hypothetical protein